MILKHSKLFDDLNIWSRLSVRFILEDYLYEGGYPKFPGPLEVATSGQYAHSIWWTKHIYLKIYIYIDPPLKLTAIALLQMSFWNFFLGPGLWCELFRLWVPTLPPPGQVFFSTWQFAPQKTCCFLGKTTVISSWNGTECITFWTLKAIVLM